MRIEVTGKMKGVTEHIRTVSDDLEYTADYPVTLQLSQLDRETYLSLKRLANLGLPLRITFECAQMELPEAVPDQTQQMMDGALAAAA